MEERRIVEKPHDEDTERAVLGLTIIDNDLANILLEKLNYSDFYNPKNAQIFEAISNLSAESSPIDYATVINRLEKNKKISPDEDPSYIYSLVDEKFYASNFEHYCAIIKEKSMLRSILALAEYAHDEVYTSKEGAYSLLGDISERILKLGQGVDSRGLVRLEDTIAETFDKINEAFNSDGALTGITTGFRDINNMLGGMQRSDMLLLAARPSVGKTALGVNMAYNSAKAGKKVAVFSLEMSRSQILQRILSMESMVPLQDIISGKISQDDFKLLFAATGKIAKLDMYVDDTPSISITELRSKVKRLKLELKELDLVVIDYLQLMTTDAKRVESRQQEVSNISRGLKALAKELNIPVLALSQLSRKSEERGDKRPMLSDLRESGAIEQDADVVMMLYRDDYYNEDSEAQNIIEVIIGKHRNGPTGTAKLFFKKENTRFFDLEYGEAEDGNY